MKYSSKITNSNNNIYVGTLTNGKPIVYIGGRVCESECRWAIESVDELIDEGETEIVCDYSSVENVSHAWFVSQFRIREQQSKEQVKILIRDSSQQSTSLLSEESTQGLTSHVQKTSPGLRSLLSNVFSFR